MDCKISTLSILLIHVLMVVSVGSLQEFTTRICEHTSIRTVQCSAGKFFNITYANYGRLSLEYCPQQSKVTNCSAALSLLIVRQKCNGLHSCELEASNSIFGDPCVSILKYLEIKYTCLEGDHFPSMPDVPNAYVYPDQIPHSHVTNINVNRSVLVKHPFFFSIFKITPIQKHVQGNSKIYADAMAFLSSTQVVPDTKSGICKPNVDGQASEFCVFRDFGSVHLFNWFVPGLNMGKSYHVSFIVRDYSSVPVVMKTNLTISVVPICFPLTEMYQAVTTHCPHDSRRFSFPTNLPWSGSSYGKRLPISVSSNGVIAKVNIDTNLLANFYRANSFYEISLNGNKRNHTMLFIYSTQVPISTMVNGVPVTTGYNFNITLNSPIQFSDTAAYVYVSLTLVFNTGERREIIFNTQNAVNLHGFNKITICPGTICLNAYSSWKNAIGKLRNTSKSSCIKDNYMQEEYLKPCNIEFIVKLSVQSGEQILRYVEIPYASPKSYIIYHLKNEIDFGDIQPTFFRVVNYTGRGISYPGYSEKYFCNPAPFDDFRKYICLNRYAGRLRVRNTAFANLPVGERFNIDVQAEATVDGSFHVRYCKISLVIVPNVTTSTTTRMSTTAFQTTDRAQTNATAVTITRAVTTRIIMNTTLMSNLTTASSRTLINKNATTTAAFPPAEQFCSNVAMCNKSLNEIHSERFFSLDNFLTYSLENLTSVRFKLWSVSIENNFSHQVVRIEIYGLHGFERISVMNKTVKLANSLNEIIINASVPYNCDRIALRQLAVSKIGLEVMDMSQIHHMTIKLARFYFCENVYCVDLNSAWKVAYPGYSCPGNPFGRFVVCAELLLLVAEKPLFNQALNLTCKGFASSISWYKDNKNLQVKSKILSLNGKSFSDQGYYRCVDESATPSITSREILIKYNDVYTSTIYLDILNKKFTSDLKNENTKAFKDLSDAVVKPVENILVNLKTQSPHDITVREFSDGQTSVIAKLRVYSHVQAGTNIDDFYSQIKSQLVSAATNNGFGNIRVSSENLIVISHEYCLAEKTNKESSKGPYQWPRTKPGRNYTAPCPNGPVKKYVTRACSGNFTHGVIWKSVEDSECSFNNIRSTKLNALSKTAINSSNAANVAKNLEEITTDSSNLTSDDAIFASETFSNLVSVNITNKIADTLLVTASNLLNANERALASSQSKEKALTSIVRGIETLADKIPLPNNTGQPVVKVSPRVAIQAMKIDASTTVISLALNAPDFKNENIISNEKFKTNEVEIGIAIPKSILSDVGANAESRLSFVVYKSSQFFQSTKLNGLGQRVKASSASPNSLVISAHVKGEKRVNLSKPLNGTFKKINQSNADKCAFWNFEANDGFGEWSSIGCRQIQADNQRVVCQCDHMTNFAILFDVYAGKKQASNEEHEKILGIISFIGIGLSLGGLGLTLITLTLFRRLRRNLPSKILMQLCLSLMLTLILFVIGADMTSPVYACRGFAIAIQYSLLVCFCWMIVEAVNLYLSFVIVMGSYVSKFMIKAGIFAWGLPIIIVAFTAWQRFTEYGNDRYCVVTGIAAYATMFAPICLALVINTITFILVFRSLSNSAKGKKITKAQKRDGLSQLRIAAAFSCILGLTWVFGLFAIADARIYFQYLFCIFNSLQGFIIFYLHVARQKEARAHWIHFLTGKGLNYYRSSMISSTKGKSAKSAKSDTYRMRTASSDQSGTLTSTLKSSDTKFNTANRT